MMTRFFSTFLFGLGLFVLVLGAWGLASFLRSEIKLFFPIFTMFIRAKDMIPFFQLIDYALNVLVLASGPFSLALILRNQIKIFSEINYLEDVIREPGKRPLTRRERFNRDINAL